MSTADFHGIKTTPTSGAEREHLGDWRGEIEIDGDVYAVHPNGRGGALLYASGCLQIDHYDDGTRQLEADEHGVISGVAGRIGLIVDGRYVERADWARKDLGIDLTGAR